MTAAFSKIYPVSVGGMGAAVLRQTDIKRLNSAESVFTRLKAVLIRSMMIGEHVGGRQRQMAASPPANRYRSGRG